MRLDASKSFIREVLRLESLTYVSLFLAVVIVWRIDVEPAIIAGEAIAARWAIIAHSAGEGGGRALGRKTRPNAPIAATQGRLRAGPDLRRPG